MDSSGSLTALEVNGPLDALHPSARSPPCHLPKSQTPTSSKAALGVSGADVDLELATLPERPATRSSQPLPNEAKEKTT